MTDRRTVGPADSYQGSLRVDDEILDRANAVPFEDLVSPATGSNREYPVKREVRILPETKAVSKAQFLRNRPTTFEFKIPEVLDDDGNPFVAMVRRPSILELLRNQATPVHIREDVNRLLKEQSKGEDAVQDTVDKDPAGALGFLLRVVDHLVIDGFVEPRVVATEEEEESDPGAVALVRIPQEARMRYYQMTQTEMTEASASISPFPGEAVESGDAGVDLRTDVVPGE